jgi:4-hydroxy-3-methylbut-2-enyl diphosphate reductase
VKTFQIPDFYRSPIISRIKNKRKLLDPKKKDLSPTILDFGDVVFYIARHFGFCYGVENAIEISFKAVDENPGKRIYLLSQMIHNPTVNKDLQERGVNFLMDTEGNTITPFNKLTANDVVIIPAFGTTLNIEKQLSEIGLDIKKYNTTCPFVERVWNKSEKLGEEKYTIIIHGKHSHEETRATFSRSETHAPSIVVKNIDDAIFLGEYILGNKTDRDFDEKFSGKISKNFDKQNDLNRIGVINQTTMLATETQAIADYLKQIMEKKYGAENIKHHFADTRDTLCYATNENQDSTYELLKQDADLAFVVGGYNSSNTSHLVELCEEKLPTYFISSADEIKSSTKISHFIYSEKMKRETINYLRGSKPLKIILTSGASCPDSMVDEVLKKILSYFPQCKKIDDVLSDF